MPIDTTACLRALLLAAGCAMTATASAAVVATITPEPVQGSLERTIGELLERHHYRQARLDDAMSALVLNAYLEDLDPGKAYLLAADVREFAVYRDQLDNMIEDGDPQPAFVIHQRFRERVAARTAWLLEHLRDPVRFDIDESIELDRRKAVWAENSSELDDFWRRRIKNDLLTMKLAGKELDAARDVLQKRYELRMKRMLQSSPTDVFQTFANSLSRSFDPHTAYFSPRSSENFNIQMRLSLEGIGAVLNLDEELVNIVELVPGGPADLSGALRPHDKIIAVGQGDDGPLVDVVGWRLDDVVDIIRGPRQTVVRLQVVPAEAGLGHPGKEVRLVRNRIQLEEQAARIDVRKVEQSGRTLSIAVLTVPTFYSDFAAQQRGDADYRSTARDVRRLLAQIDSKSIDGMVVDLRQNGGGSLQEAVELSGLFIRSGPIVQVRNANGKVRLEDDPDKAILYEGPMMVMVDRSSASASEIFAAALQDYGRAVVVGSTTYGKGTVQSMIDLDRFGNDDVRRGQLKMTIAKFYRVNGSSTQHRGVLPDLPLPTALGEDEIGESAQDRALPWDDIAKARYQAIDQVGELLPELRRRHEARMQSDATLKTWREDLDWLRERRSRTVLSLLESERRAEREALRQRQVRMGNRSEVEDDDDEQRPRRRGKEGPDPGLDATLAAMTDLIALRPSVVKKPTKH